MNNVIIRTYNIKIDRKTGMELLRNEKNLLNFIKYGALITIVLFAFIIANIFIDEKNKDLDSEIKKLEESYIIHNKAMVENLVNKIYKLIELERKFEREDFNNEIKEEIYQAHFIATSIYNNQINKPNYSKEKTIGLIKKALSEFKFNAGEGYVFVYEMTGKVILNPRFQNLEGKNLWDYKDSKGTLIVQEMNKILSSKDEAFYEWYWNKNEEEISQKKIGFFKKFEPYNLFIGTGYYINDFREQTQKRVLEKLNSFELKLPEHIYIYDLKGTCLVNPKKELIGINRYDVKSDDGRYNLREFLDFAVKNKEGFIKYKSTVMLNDELKSNDKISFVKLYEDWGWMIGSGFYLEELNKEIQEKKDALIASNKKSVEVISLIGLFLTLIVIFISFYLSKTISNIFIDYKEKIDDELKAKFEKDRILVQQSKMATMGEMIGSIAHQWKQPLSVISMANALLRINREMKDFSSEKEIDDAIDDIDKSTHNLSQTIDDFRNFFNPNKQKVQFKISDAIEDTLKLISSQLRNNNIEVIKDIEDIELNGYQNELLQTLINLFKNSKEELIKKPSSEKRYIFIDAYKEKNHLIIKIKDNANGIPENIIERVFEPYFTTKEKDGGTGIGLYMCKQIIEESMYGKIEVSNVKFTYENENYQGAEFKISILINLENKKV